MKKIVFMLLMIGMAVFVLGSVKDVKAQELKQGEAIIIRAQYQGDRFILQLEMDGKVYDGRLSHRFTNDDYLALHHNVGMVVEIAYRMENGELVIYSWHILK